MKAVSALLLLVACTLAGCRQIGRNNPASLQPAHESYEWYNNGDRCTCTRIVVAEEADVAESRGTVLQRLREIPVRPGFAGVAEIRAMNGGGGVEEECRPVLGYPYPLKVYYEPEGPDASAAGYPGYPVVERSKPDVLGAGPQLGHKTVDEEREDFLNMADI